MIRLFVAAILVAVSTSADAQSSSTAPATAAAPTLPMKGTILRALVLDVVISTSDESGSYTAFLIRPPDQNTAAFWFYVRNDDVTKALERGAMIGLLMGAAEANRWSSSDGPSPVVNIKYETVRGKRIITDAALADRLGIPR